jgi:hypothetical protein
VLESPFVQYGGLGLAFLVVIAFVRAFFLLLVQRQKLQEEMLAHHAQREKAFAAQFIACVDRNSAALEKVEQGLQKIRLELARRGSPRGHAVCVPYE